MSNLIIILGPTGIGKTALSVDIAEYLNTEILSCDSRQFYREMNIGTAVPSKEELSKVKHHFIHHLSIQDYYNASKFEEESLALLKLLFTTHDYAVMVGGSGLYIDAVCKGIDEFPTTDPDMRKEIQNKYESDGIEYLRTQLKLLDPETYAKVDLRNPNRMMKAIEVTLMTGQPYSNFLKGNNKVRPFNIHKIGLQMDREALYDRINQRVDIMIEKGLEREVKELHEKKGIPALNTVGYRELFDYFDKKHSLEKAIELIKRNTRHYARRQITWFNRYNDIKWFDVASKDEIMNYISEINRPY